MNKFDPRLLLMPRAPVELKACADQLDVARHFWGRHARRVIRYKNLSLSRKIEERREAVHFTRNIGMQITLDSISRSSVTNRRHAPIAYYDTEMSADFSPAFLARFGLSPKETP